MGLLERMMKENVERGIVPKATQQHSKYLTCEKCGEEINPRYEGSTGRYVEGNPIPVYAHAEGFCPDGEPEEYDPWAQ